MKHHSSGKECIGELDRGGWSVEMAGSEELCTPVQVLYYGEIGPRFTDTTHLYLITAHVCKEAPKGENRVTHRNGSR